MQKVLKNKFEPGEVLSDPTISFYFYCGNHEFGEKHIGLYSCWDIRM
jgi:hypothetical protein